MTWSPVRGPSNQSWLLEKRRGTEPVITAADAASLPALAWRAPRAILGRRIPQRVQAEGVSVLAASGAWPGHMANSPIRRRAEPVVRLQVAV